MRLRSLCSASACAALLAFVSSIAFAQPAPATPPAAPLAAAPAREPLRLTFDLHGGLIYRVGPLDSDPSRGGGLLGLDALVGTSRWWAAGVGYDHVFVGSERIDGGAGMFRDQHRTLDELWALGRFYPWQNDDVAVYLGLGVGPAWQRVDASNDVAGTGPLGDVMLTNTSCSGRATVGLGLRGGAGADVALNNFVMFYGEVGVDHFRLTDQAINGCANGMGSATFLATRFGFAVGTGRQKPPEPPPPPPPSDRDGDAIPDTADACPDRVGLPNDDPAKNGCPPPPDRDHDGIPDDLDACPDQAGAPSDDPKASGCPDRDDDHVVDPLDACPDIPGRASDDPKENGCPPDTDGDGIRDDKDACPNEKGLPNDDPTKNGCPLVVVRSSEIVITDQIDFDVERATIRKSSNALLDSIADVMKAHPELRKIEVQGHTDDTGTPAHNKVLSAARADAVKRALVKRGVAERRLSTRGFGQEKPIADNATAAGKAKNRRVQFLIVEREKPPPAAEEKK